MNDFSIDLKFSHENESMHIWHDIYKKAFPGFLSMTNTRDDGELQRFGIDRTIVLKSGKAIYIDEKVRRKNYGDILLEYVANDKTKSKGWVEKPLFADYISYAVIDSSKCYLLPVPQLQSAWEENKFIWLDKYKTKAAQNQYYNTLSCPVPVDELYRNIGKMLRVDFSSKNVEIT